MATLLLYAVGQAAGVSVAAAQGISAASIVFNGFAVAGGALGSVIDQRWLGPLLAQDPPKQRYLEHQIQGTDDGQPMSRCYGRQVRVPGQLLWLGELERIDRDVNAGKGGAGGNTVEHVYNTSLLVGICRGPIRRVLKVWADGKLIYDVLSASFDETSSNVSATASYTFSGQTSLSPTATFTGTYTHRLRITAPAGDIDLSQLVSGRNVLTQGFANALNNRDARCSERGTLSDGSTYAVIRWEEKVTTSGGIYPPPSQGGATEAAGSSVTITQGHLSYLGSVARRITFYDGSEDQQPDPYLQALEPEEGGIAYRGTACMFFEGLQLFDFGNRTPNLSFLVESAQSQTVGEAIASMCEDAGLESDEFDVSACDGELLGYAAAGHNAAAADISPLLVSHDLLVSERAGRLTFTPRRDLRVVAIEETNLGCAPYAERDSVPQAVEIAVESNAAQVSDVVVRHIDPEKEWQPGTRRSVRTSMPRRTTQSVELPVVIDSTEAQAIAKRTLWNSASMSRRLTISIPPSDWPRVNEADILTFTANGRDWTMIAQRLDRSPLLHMLATGYAEQRHLATAFDPAPGPAFSTAPSGLARSPSVEWTMFEAHALDDEHALSPGLYFAACVADADATFNGATIFESLDAGTTYSQVGRVGTGAAMGLLDTELAAWPTPEVWDDVNTFDVRMIAGSLESVTDADCLNGMNRMSIDDGAEIVGFATVESLGDGVYRLSRLLRGRGYTEERAKSGPHEVQSMCVLLTGGGVSWLSRNPAAIGQERWYRVVPSGGLLDDFEGRPITLQGRTCKQPTVANLAATRNGSDDITLTWRRRTRTITRTLGQVPAPRIEPVEAYTVEIIDDGDIVRTIAASSPTCTYTAAQQTADGLTPGNPVTARISQDSDLAGRGDVLERTV